MPNNKYQFILECCQLNFAFSNGKSLFKKLNLQIPKGAFALIKGPSGTGKSTLLRLCNRLEEPAQGEILFKGRPVQQFTPSLLRRQMAYVQQTPVVLDAPVRDNLLLSFGFKQNQDLAPPTEDMLRQELKHFLPDTALEENALNLSGGQRQRLCLLRALLLQPELLLLDEPTSALDPENRSMVEGIVEKLNADQGKTVLFVSHQEYVPRNVRSLLTIRIRDGQAEILTDQQKDPVWK